MIKGVVITWVSLFLTSFCQHMPTVLLKQAADKLMESPFTSRDSASGLARIEIPAAEDLLIRRLQGELALRVEDNWRSINEPQRWQILQSKGASKQILKSFSLLKDKMAELERDTNIPAVEKILNDLQVSSNEMNGWVNFWDVLRRKVGQIAQLYNFFRGYIEKPDGATDRVLQDFATSVVKSSVEERTMKNMLISFHEAVIPKDSQKKELFPYFQSLLAKVKSRSQLNCVNHVQLKYNILRCP